MVYKFFDEKTRSGIIVNGQLATSLHKPVIKNKLKVEKSMQNLKITFGHQIYLKWNYCIQRIKMLNTYYVL